MVGRLGEELACRILLGVPGVLSVEWVNRDFESGLPYDIIYRRRAIPDAVAASPLGAALAFGAGGVEDVFVEVKSTTGPPMASPFYMSLPEAALAYQLGPRYEVMRLFQVGVRPMPEVNYLRNLPALLVSGLARLLLFPPSLRQPMHFPEPDAQFVGDGSGGDGGGVGDGGGDNGGGGGLSQ